ncbi:DOPA 4,5-dioxygenase family protein [Hwanghaeella grinnelliae]|uniref:DOPA 4,5-dioxygenase family protein n=1 Tax=Hwanghaeella grinnelliae TaxID=2500179 RepID=UPI001F01619F|nr:DOPA 4,5-dioxygenase family protein [Hwanghaeella grinnelliae]
MTADDERKAVTVVGDIQGWHAHVYFDGESAPVAQRVRDQVSERFDIRMGRWHEKLVGPHPRWSYQIGFSPEQFADVISWLALNRSGLTVFIHPETGDDLIDHTAHTIWMGEMLDLNLEMFRR